MEKLRRRILIVGVIVYAICLQVGPRVFHPVAYEAVRLVATVSGLAWMWCAIDIIEDKVGPLYQALRIGIKPGEIYVIIRYCMMTRPLCGASFAAAGVYMKTRTWRWQGPRELAFKVGTASNNIWARYAREKDEVVARCKAHVENMKAQ